jgi:aminoglycoside phosphotransferase (APT) family kinase protein
VRLLPDIGQPVEVEGQIATFWQTVPAAGPPSTGADLGWLLRRLHAITTPPPDLPRWNPILGIRSRLADAEGLDVNVHEYLQSTCDEVEKALASVKYALPQGVLHGDATVANLISGPAGPVICDFDSSSIGPQEWDLTPVATGHYRFRNKADNLTPLSMAYGFDITTWDGFPVLRRLRELQLVTSVVPVLLSNPALREQWAHRLDSFRRGDPNTKWSLYN